MRVEIAGAGFAGLVAAISLAKQGWSVRVHEAAHELRAFGAGIFLWENGLRVLQEIDVYDQVMPNAFHGTSWDDVNETGDLLISRPLPIPQGSRMVTMTREDLHAPLVKKAQELGVDIVTDSKAETATPDGCLILENGERLKADLVIAADGIRSQIVQSLNLVKDHQVFPVGVIRTLVPRSAEEILQPEWHRYINFWSDRRRILYVPCNDNDLYLLLGAQLPDKEAMQHPIKSKVWADEFPALANAVSRVSANARFDQYEVKTCKSWSLGKVAVVGDAAHAMPPTIGQGAGTAMLNAMMLSRYVSGSDAVEEGLRRWEANERGLTDYTQRVSVGRASAWKPEAQSGAMGWSPHLIRTALHDSFVN